MLQSPIYLVPYDFSEIAESAFVLALQLAKRNNGTVYLLHIAKTEADERKAHVRMSDMVRNLSEVGKKRVFVKVLRGNLYKSVAIAGEILGANLTVMGTHGMTGMQRLLGSNALKMVAMSSTPYLLLVKEQNLRKVDTIVMPFSFVEDTLFVLDALVEFAKQYESAIHLVGYYDKVEWQNQRSSENQQTARNFLERRGLECEIVNLPRKKSYEQELSDYMFEVNADLIAASYFKNSRVPPPNSFIQVMLDSDNLLPMLTVNGDAFKVKV
ncbi:MAG: universal stress protein [bacterium]|nr:universal stress protein [bacterium]